MNFFSGRVESSSCASQSHSYSTTCQYYHTNSHTLSTYIERETKDAIDVLHKQDGIRDLGFDLRRHTEDMSVILLEAAHTRKARKSTAQSDVVCTCNASVRYVWGLHDRERERETAGLQRLIIDILVSVQYTKVGKTDWQLTVRAHTVAEHDTMAGTVHGLQGKVLVLSREAEHVVLVVLPMARGLEQLFGEDVWRHDLGEATAPVFALYQTRLA
jgi:hypothetical protein